MKKICSILLVVVLLLSCAAPAYATDTSREYFFELTVDGGNEKKVQTGDIITVVFTLYRTDSEADYAMYAMQNEIHYDSNFFRLVEGSAMLSEGISTTDIGLRDHYREFYMNFVSLFGGETWKVKRMVGSFQLEVIGTSGITKITNEDYLVSVAGGNDQFAASCQDVTIILSTDCTVTFETNGGSAMDPVIAQYGETVARPADPVRAGYHLEGWYSDLDLQTAWDFDKDVVRGNMTLYAKWAAGDPEPNQPGEQEPDPDDDEPANLWWLVILGGVLLVLALILLLLPAGKRKTVTFQTNCKTKIQPQKVKKGGYAQRPEDIKKEGKTFAGWFYDPQYEERWYFESDKVQEDVTLYARWI